MDDTARQQLTRSPAGMRLVAQLSIFNKGDFDRLRQFMNDYYTEEALADTSLKARLAEQKAIYRLSGKLRFDQLMAYGEHEVIVALACEKGAQNFMAHIAVTEDYPHKVLLYVQRALEASEFDNDVETLS